MAHTLLCTGPAPDGRTSGLLALGALIVAAGVASCGGEVSGESPANDPDGYAACFAGCETNTECPLDPAFPCNIQCAEYTEAAPQMGCAAELADFDACLEGHPACGPCYMQEMVLYDCMNRFCGDDTQSAACWIGGSCQSSTDCGEGQDCVWVPSVGLGICLVPSG